MIFDIIWFIIYDSRVFNEFTYDEQCYLTSFNIIKYKYIFAGYLDNRIVQIWSINLSIYFFLYCAASANLSIISSYGI